MRCPIAGIIAVLGANLAACAFPEEGPSLAIERATAKVGAKGHPASIGATTVSTIPIVPKSKPDRDDQGGQAFGAASVTALENRVAADEVLQRAKDHLANLVRRGLITSLFEEEAGSRASETAEGYFVQIGSYEMQTAADAQLDLARRRFGGLLASFDIRVSTTTLDRKGPVFRVQIGPLKTQTSAIDLCAALKRINQDCFTLAAPTARLAEQPRNQLEGGWASIDIGEQPSRTSPASPRPMPLTSQVADASPLFTAPGLPGVLE